MSTLSTASATDSLIFPQATNFSQILRSLRASNLCITNRLRSIDTDSVFVNLVAAAYGLPLLANERCGSWYVPPERKAGSSYFKSTDGHTGQWSFNLRRLNLHILDLIEKEGGYVEEVR